MLTTVLNLPSYKRLALRQLDALTGKGGRCSREEPSACDADLAGCGAGGSGGTRSAGVRDPSASLLRRQQRRRWPLPQ